MPLENDRTTFVFDNLFVAQLHFLQVSTFHDGVGQFVVGFSAESRRPQSQQSLDRHQHATVHHHEWFQCCGRNKLKHLGAEMTYIAAGGTDPQIYWRSGADWTAWHFPGGPSGPASRWAATSVVQTTYPEKTVGMKGSHDTYYTIQK